MAKLIAAAAECVECTSGGDAGDRITPESQPGDLPPTGPNIIRVVPDDIVSGQRIVTDTPFTPSGQPKPSASAPAVDGAPNIISTPPSTAGTASTWRGALVLGALILGALLVGGLVEDEKQ